MAAAGQSLVLGICVLAAGPAVAGEPRPLAELPLHDGGGLRVSDDVAWLEFSPDGRWLAICYRTAYRRARVRVWSRPEWKAADCDFETQTDDWMRTGRSGAAFDSKGGSLYFCSDGRLHALGLPPKGPASTTDLRLSDTRAPRQVVALHDDRTLVVSTGGGGLDAFGVHRVPLDGPGERAKLFAGKWSNLRATAASRDGSRVAVGFDVDAADMPDHVLEVWDAGGTRPRFRRERLRGEVWVAEFSPDGKVLATGGADGMVTLWDADGGRLVRSWAEDYSISSVDFHPTRAVVAYTVRERRGKPNLRLADVSTGRVLAGLRPDPDASFRARFSPDGKALAVLGTGHTVRVWAVGSLIGD